MNIDDFDLVIVGSGPAGIFCALEVIKIAPKARILMLDKGKLRNPEDNNVLSGWGGAGAFSDGKLNLTDKVGGSLVKFVGQKEFDGLVKYVHSTYIDFGADKEVKTPDPNKVKELSHRASEAGFELIAFPISHLGTDKVWQIARNMYDCLINSGVKISMNSRVADIKPADEGKWQIIVKQGKSEKVYLTKNVFIAVGRGAEDWWIELAGRLKLRLKRNVIDVGFRVEVPNEALEEWTGALYEAKLQFRTGLDEVVRTFCMCPSGQVVAERHDGGMLLSNGRSYKDPQKKSGNTNFAILNTTNLTSPFKDPVGYGRKIAGLANALAGGNKLLIQRLFDFKKRRRTDHKRLASAGIKSTISPKLVEPGDLARAYPEPNAYNLRECINALIKLIPAIGRNNGNDALLIGPEVKFYTAQTQLSKNLETKHPGLYVGGDVSGWIRGLMQSSMSGVIVARAIVKKLGSSQVS